MVSVKIYKSSDVLLWDMGNRSWWGVGKFRLCVVGEEGPGLVVEQKKTETSKGTTPVKDTYLSICTTYQNVDTIKKTYNSSK